jgi:hypothetical protein
VTLGAFCLRCLGFLPGFSADATLVCPRGLAFLAGPATRVFLSTARRSDSRQYGRPTAWLRSGDGPASAPKHSRYLTRVAWSRRMIAPSCVFRWYHQDTTKQLTPRPGTGRNRGEAKPGPRPQLNAVLRTTWCIIGSQSGNHLAKKLTVCDDPRMAFVHPLSASSAAEGRLRPYVRSVSLPGDPCPVCRLHLIRGSLE